MNQGEESFAVWDFWWPIQKLSPSYVLNLVGIGVACPDLFGFLNAVEFGEVDFFAGCGEVCRYSC